MFTGDYGFFDYKYHITGYTGQDYGGPAQTVYLTVSAMLLIGLISVLRKSSRDRVRRIVGFTGVFLALFYLGKTAWESYYDIRLNGGFNTGILPLDTCSLVVPAALLAGFGRGKAQRLAEGWMATGSVVGGIATMVRLNAFNFYPFLSFGGFYSMLWHLLMVFLGLLLIVTDRECCGAKTVHRGFAFHLLFSAVVIPVDFIWGFDFMLYRDLGGVPIFEDAASRFTAAGLGFLNPILMLVLYYLAFWLVAGTALLVRKAGSSQRPRTASGSPALHRR